MTLWEATVAIGSVAGLSVAGWLFLNRSLYRNHEGKDPVVQARLFSLRGNVSVKLARVALRLQLRLVHEQRSFFLFASMSYVLQAMF